VKPCSGAEKEEKKEAFDSWIRLTEEELGFVEAMHEIIENSTTKEEFYFIFILNKYKHGENNNDKGRCI
jgi:hypothetical protein